MSTFDGLIDEFPSIRIDYFRNHPNRPPPQACFLSHVHSDHLQGLDTLKMPFVYCAAATKSVLLRMEKYPHRINFAKGVLEARKQTYKHLNSVLRALPLETPVEIALDPKSTVRVTLFDANHCPGSVMFLIEGNGAAILYTGDVRAESWWVNSTVRNPILLPYSLGMKRLNTIYLDTTFASHRDIHEQFPTKAEGLKELLAKVSKCPKGATYYFRSWTLGYEDVWIALSHFLQSPIHVDNYQLRIFRSLVEDADPLNRGTSLAGFAFGNQYHPGCLTDDDKVSIHSCEPGSKCHDKIRKRRNVVWISPIISRLKDGSELSETGAGGGGGDLYQSRQLEVVDEESMNSLETLCAVSLKHKEPLARLNRAFSEARSKGDLVISLEGLGLDQGDEVTLQTFVQFISSKDQSSDNHAAQDNSADRTIHFPYSRHSSYSELRHLVSSFRPGDICPCTVDAENWTEEVSMQSLFGDLCSDDIFKHDQKLRALATERPSTRKISETQDSVREVEPSVSQRTRSQTSRDSSQIYRSAKTSLRRENTDESRSVATTAQKPQQQYHESIPDASDQCSIPQHIKALNQELAGLFDDSASHSHSQLSPMLESDQDTKVPFLPLSSFHPLDSDTATVTSAPDTDVKRGLQSRIQACHAAQRLLNQHDRSAWENLHLRSVGWKGHTEQETML